MYDLETEVDKKIDGGRKKWRQQRRRCRRRCHRRWERRDIITWPHKVFFERSRSVELLFITVAQASSVQNFVLDSSISAIKFHITNIHGTFCTVGLGIRIQFSNDCYVQSK